MCSNARFGQRFLENILIRHPMPAKLEHASSSVAGDALEEVVQLV
jgi:hypothetical protein